MADRLRVATGIVDRFLGLMGRADLPFGEGLRIAPCNSIHMFFMRFPIDAAFLDADERVIKAYHALMPWRVSGVHFGARSVVELPAGTLQASKTAEGDLLAFELW